MRASPYLYSAYRTPASLRSRVIAGGLAIALGALLILVLLRMGAFPALSRRETNVLATFRVLPPAPVESQGSPKPVAPKRATRRKQEQRAAPPPPALPPPPIVLPGVIQLSRADFRASDVGRFPNAKADPGQGEKVADNAGDSAAAYGPGDGPGGQKLYYAEWYREPTRAEMATYLPAQRQSGWGMVACRTAEKFRVEDCREIGETPGSGIARALRQASWQFLIRPPRIGGKPVIGALVRIKYDLLIGVVK